MSLVVVVAACGALAPLVRAQGALTPPGAPAPTMKTLAQIEPRTALQAGAAGVTLNANGGFSIIASGSYYLTGDLVVGTDYAILISADDVTLDLNGFSIRSVAVSGVIGAGVQTSFGRDRITIRNGSIHGQGTVDLSTTPDTYTDLGFSSGISASTSEQVLVEGIHVTGMQNGISLGQGSGVVRNCTAARISGSGIVGVHVESCVARLIGGNGITAQIATHCTGETQSGFGVSAQQATNCRGIAYNGLGLRAQRVTDCYGQSYSSQGIDGSIVANSVGSSTHGNGIVAISATLCSGSSVYGSGIAAQATVSDCYGYTASGFAGIDGRQVANSEGINDAGSYGLRASYSALHSFGQNYNGSGFGLEGSAMAVFCRGVNYGGGYGMSAQMAIGCTYFGQLSVGQKYLMP